MRTFIAVELSEEQKNKLLELQQAIKKVGMQAKFVEKENIHITLKFLGEIEQKDLDIIKDSIEEAVQGIKSFQISIKGVGAFPSLARPRVIWADVEDGKDELIELANRIDEKVVLREFDKKPFSPHITVARLKTPKHIAALAEIERDYEEFEFGKITVSEVKIKESELTPKGPIYRDLIFFGLE
ncbi:TPA: RNA 2',3'-cyclic phosphodiesterase [archaeon]|uniref:RNA 2',3'-cyclic phosphodiesterase n=1 Tax=Candidatus Naiadarchaeum limnaeum TaxID=2756139 RepID=A0A832V9T2_9ARCH|nr:RNA 2',3'-cyclic phosphodiesterase [Candidatus Naiadarchaeales archaeon SRR2090153.bin1042]HIK00211.1 RNA 2',3'-cyclic phosphodiesterase [Candidatus Naiadarchaeum limnaeum]